MDASVHSTHYYHSLPQLHSCLLSFVHKNFLPRLSWETLSNPPAQDQHGQHRVTPAPKTKGRKKQKGSRKLCKVSQECVGIPKTLVALFFPVLKSTRLGCMAHWYIACPALIGSWLPASTLHKPDVTGMCLSFSTLETDRSIRSSWSSLHYIANLRQGRTTWDLIFKKKIQFCV